MAPNNFAVALGPKSKTRTMPQLSVSVSIIIHALRVGRTTFLSLLPIKQMLATLMYINSSSNIFTCSHTRSNCKLLWDRDQLGQESKNHLSLSASLTRSRLRKLTWKRGKNNNKQWSLKIWQVVNLSPYHYTWNLRQRYLEPETWTLK